MIDRELIKMCDVPEIQDRWEPKVGDRVWSKDRDELDISKIDEDTGQIKFYGDNVHIPRIEEVLGWLEAYKYSIDVVGESDLWEIFHVNSVWSDTPIKSLLKAYMHLEHSKTWNGEVWA
jgi:hypothetical protein